MQYEHDARLDAPRMLSGHKLHTVGLVHIVMYLPIPDALSEAFLYWFLYHTYGTFNKNIVNTFTSFFLPACVKFPKRGNVLT